uniref:Uncharacterized protein n=1 Tax=Apteryx owenii TaxID=8824 RepID=A0A8B9NYT4_APTOW
MAERGPALTRAAPRCLRALLLLCPACWRHQALSAACIFICLVRVQLLNVRATALESNRLAETYRASSPRAPLSPSSVITFKEAIRWAWHDLFLMNPGCSPAIRSLSHKHLH